jgi:hypothetical protein
MIDYAVLGKTEKTRARRFRVLMLLAKGAAPPEIRKMTGVALSTVYEDLRAIRRLQEAGSSVPLSVIVADGETWYQQKMRELEARAERVKDSNVPVWLGIQRTLIDLKRDDLKLKGAFVERNEVSVDTADRVVRKLLGPEGEEREKRR